MPHAITLRNILGHFKTITHHRHLVLRGCFRVGLYWQGLCHDLSKYSPTEFWTGVRYYQGTRSPNAAEREEKGYSEAWMHHKGRNRHHFEYWTDLNMKTGRYEPVPMPPRLKPCGRGGWCIRATARARSSTPQARRTPPTDRRCIPERAGSSRTRSAPR